MDNLLVSIILQAIVSIGVISFIHTLYKEKITIEDGGDPFPTSAYTRLIGQYIIWGLLIYLFFYIGYTIPLYTYFLLFMGTYLLAFVLGVVSRVVISFVFRLVKADKK